MGHGGQQFADLRIDARVLQRRGHPLGARLLYAVAATGFGLMLAACCTVSDRLWLGIGFHSGYDAFNGRFIRVHQVAFIPASLIVLGVVIVGAAFIIAVRQWRAPLDWRAVSGDT